MRKYIQISLFLAGFLLFLSGCYKSSDYPVTPQISLLDFKHINRGQQYLDSFYFTISYLDGDGDLGLNDNFRADSPFNKRPYSSNFFLEYYEKIDGEFRKVKPRLSNEDTISFDWGFPVLNESEKPKTIKGDISVGVNWMKAPVYSNIIKFKLYIYDRKLHKSNVVETREIIRK